MLIGSPTYRPKLSQISVGDLYSFGMQVKERSWSDSSFSYRFGFQGQEGDDEINGEGNSIEYKYRIHDSRLGRFLSVDPLSAEFAWNSTYAFSENRVIDAIELEGLEAYVLTQIRNEDGSFESSSLVWNETASPLADGQLYYTEIKGGMVEVDMMAMDAGRIHYKGPELLPTPAPESILGGNDYYQWRDNDFNVLQTLMDDIWSWQPSSPEYYLGYGDKYIQRFSNETNQKLSTAGQEWLGEARINLQMAIEEKLKTDPQIELDNSSFTTFAFDSHVPAYENAGLFALPISDLVQIGLTPDFSDLLSTDGLRQVKQVATDYPGYIKENPTETLKTWISFGLQIYDYISDDDEE